MFFLGFDGGSCKAMLPTLLVLSPASVANAPTHDQVAHVKPKLGPKRAHIAPNSGAS